MQFVSAKDNAGDLEIDVDLSAQEVGNFMTKHDGAIRRKYRGVEFFHPLDHPVKNRLRLIIPGQRRPGESIEAAAQRVYDELETVMRHG